MGGKTIKEKKNEPEIVFDKCGRKRVQINNIIFSSKRRIDWTNVEKYLKQYIGRYTIRFSMPICNEKGDYVGRNNFQGRMIVRHDSDGKKYLYDIIDIKKET